MPSSVYPRAATPLDLPLVGDGGAPSLAAAQAQVLELFDTAAPGLRRYVQSCGLSAEAAEDVVQDAFLALFRHLRSGGAQHNLRGWLVQVCHYQALKHRERQARRYRHEAAPRWELADVVDDTTESPDVQLTAREERRRLVAVFRALPERDRQCLSLRAEGLRYREIASTLGISLGSVAKSIAQAVSRLSRAISG
jgi:RNA polymerase sigma-70 factor, ECF subfamily